MFCKRFSPVTGREEWCLMEEDYDNRRDILRYYEWKYRQKVYSDLLIL